MAAYKIRPTFSRVERASDMAKGNLVHEGKHRGVLLRFSLRLARAFFRDHYFYFYYWIGSASGSV